MKTKFKMNPNTLMVLCILGVALIANTITIVVNSGGSDMPAIDSYRKTILPLNILDFIKIAIILVMAYFIFIIVKKVLRNEKWNDKYYRAIKQIGWLSVFVLLLDAVSFVAREQYIYKNAPVTDLLSNPLDYPGILAQALFSSPVAWFLICCIFLLADVLQYANELKKENESII